MEGRQKKKKKKGFFVYHLSFPSLSFPRFKLLPLYSELGESQPCCKKSDYNSVKCLWLYHAPSYGDNPFKLDSRTLQLKKKIKN